MAYKKRRRYKVKVVRIRKRKYYRKGSKNRYYKKRRHSAKRRGYGKYRKKRVYIRLSRGGLRA